VVFRRAGQATLLLSGSGGYGFLATVEQMSSRLKAGKAFVSCSDGETLTQPLAGVGCHPAPCRCRQPPMWPVRPPAGAS
jgi:hypothetical protein